MVAQLNALVGGGTYADVTYAVNGTNTQFWTPTGGNHVQDAITAFNAAGGCQSVSILLGTNDANGNSLDAATYGSHMSGIISSLETAGYTTIILQFQPFLNSTGCPSSCSPNTAANALLQQYETQLLALASADTHVLIGDRLAYTYFQSNTNNLQSDGVHPTGSPANAGYIALANLWYNAFVSLFISPTVTNKNSLGMFG